jgi:L-threonylcarbamoyladenylate synthase
LVRVLSEGGNPVEAAAGLFRILHELDGLRVSGILAEKVPTGGLGDAINDRLFKARAAAR